MLGDRNMGHARREPTSMVHLTDSYIDNKWSMETQNPSYYCYNGRRIDCPTQQASINKVALE